MHATAAATAAVGICALRCIRWKEALRELDIAQQTSVPLNVFIYGAAITAMSRSGRYAEGCALLDKMLAAGLKANVITYNAAMSGCAKCGKWQEVSCLC
jgi:pentatricopeptide repeat domain-containing protein 1